MTGTRILEGDATLLLRDIPTASIDLVIADPPYNLGKDYGNNHDLKGFAEYLAFSSAWLTEAHRVQKPTGALYCFMGVRFISYLYDILDQQLGMYFYSRAFAKSKIKRRDYQSFNEICARRVQTT